LQALQAMAMGRDGSIACNSCLPELQAIAGNRPKLQGIFAGKPLPVAG
jgi:hypothetical protein